MKRARWLGPAALAGLLGWLHRYLFTGQVMAGRDLFRLSIPQSVVMRERLLAGELPLWLNGARLGQPFLALLDTQVLYPPRLLLVLAFGAVWGVNLMMPLHAAIASAGAYRAARSLGATRPAAWVALAFGVTPFFARLEQMLAAICSLSWSGWVLAAAVALARRPSGRRAALLAVVFALAALSGAPETLLWQGAVALAGVLCVRWRRARRPALWVAGALALGVGLAAVTYVPGAELWWQWRVPPSEWTQSLDWSVSWPQLLSLGWLYADRPLSPDFWGPDQQLTSSLFIGTLGCALAFFAGRRRWPLLVLAGACAALSLGRHLPAAGWLIAHTPLSVFRFPVKYAFAVAFLVALLAALGAQRLAARLRRRPLASRTWLYAIAAGLALGFGTVAVLRRLPVRAGLPSGALWAMGALLAAAVVLFALRERPRRVPFALAALVFFELSGAHLLVPTLATFDPAELTRPSQLAGRLRAAGVQRLSVVLEHGEPPKGEPDAAAAESTRYVRSSRENLVPLRFLEEHLEAVEGYGFRDSWPLVQALAETNLGLYQALGVSHFLRSGGPPFEGLTELPGTRDVRVFATTPFPRGWVVQRARRLGQGPEQPLTAGPVELRTTVWLDRQSRDAEPCESQVRPTERAEERVGFEVDACAAGWLVMSDAYFPGWAATVDGRPAPVLRADRVLRAVAIDSGHHVVSLTYRPMSLVVGAGVSLVAAGILAALLRRRKVS